MKNNQEQQVAEEKKDKVSLRVKTGVRAGPVPTIGGPPVA
jgi:hypothetical protein